MDKVAAATTDTAGGEEDTTTTTTSNKKTQDAAGTTAAPKAAEQQCCCCPKFDDRIESFQEKEWKFENKPFIKESTWCFLYIPLNFGGATTRACSKIKAADAAVPDEELIMLSDMKSRWSTRILFSVNKDEVPGADMVHLSGTFLTKVFEGPYSDFAKWIKEMKAYVQKEMTIKKKDKEEAGGSVVDVDKCEIYAHYATCPGCAKKYGKNYTVLFVKVA